MAYLLYARIWHDLSMHFFEENFCHSIDKRVFSQIPIQHPYLALFYASIVLSTPADLHYSIGKVETYQSESLVGQKIFLRSGIWISCVKFHKNRKIDKQHHRGCRLTCARGVTLFCSEIKVKVGAKTDLDTDNEPSVSRFFPNIAFWGQQPTSHILIFSTTCPLCPVIRQCVSHLTSDMLMLMHSHSLNFSKRLILNT